MSHREGFTPPYIPALESPPESARRARNWVFSLCFHIVTTPPRSVRAGDFRRGRVYPALRGGPFPGPSTPWPAGRWSLSLPLPWPFWSLHLSHRFPTSFFDRFLVDFGPQNRSKIDPKSTLNPSSFQVCFLLRFLRDLLSLFFQTINNPNP